MKRLTAVSSQGQYIDGEWQVKNLQALVKFMKKAGLTTGDVAKAMNVSRNTITRWLQTDDCSLKKMMDVAEAFDCELTLSYILPDEEADDSKIIIDKLISNLTARKFKPGRLTFLSIAMQQGGVTKVDLAESIGLTRASIQRWFQQDDMNMKYIYKIAELYGWELHIEYRLKA